MKLTDVHPNQPTERASEKRVEKGSRLAVWVTAKEKAAISLACLATGKKTATFIREAAVDKAADTLKVNEKELLALLLPVTTED